MNRLQQYVFGKLGKLKHEIDLEAHAYDRLYWMDLRQRGMKEDLEKLKERVAELEKARHDKSKRNYFKVATERRVSSGGDRKVVTSKI